ncbi:DUF2381 family protein [Archangium sp.]|uniref:DUF2381 family protein n=1 Tax=Archangium sp. TaxID=1872627 RepID=UPI002D24D8EE|nr:DUF2381 family protein [Archangium sp.]HYO59068.1 DUF2381 family protein [Archangium sp.]
MVRLLQWLPLVLLLTGGAAAAQQQPQPPVRERQERQVVVPNNSNEPVPEVRVAARVSTYFRFDAPIDRAAVEIEGRPVRFRWVDVGERLVAVEPAVDLGAEEKLVVRVRYKDGASPAVATLVLVTHPTLVDKEVEVVRQARSREALEAALAEKEAAFTALKAQCARSGLPHLAFSGLLDSKDIQVRPFLGMAAPGHNSGLAPESGTGYRATRWAMVVVRVRNLPGQPAWAPGTARLTSASGAKVKVHSVHMEKPQLQPGEAALVVVMVEPPSANEKLFQLDLVDAQGRRLLPLTEVEL